MKGLDFSTSTTPAQYTYQPQPPCFVCKCNNCIYRNCCANANNTYVPTYPVITYTTQAHACGIDNEPCSVQGNCNECGKCKK